MDRWEVEEYIRQTQGGEPEPRRFRRYQSPNTESGTIVATYVYVTQDGQPYHKVVRRDPKGFSQHQWFQGTWLSGQPEGGTLPYRLQQLVGAEPDQPVFITEGEKDADTLAAMGFVATTNPGGAGKWTADHAKWLAGRKTVYVLEDNDDSGRVHALKVANSLAGIVPDIRIVTFRDLLEHGDVTEWVEEGGTRDGLLERCKLAKPRDENNAISALPFEWIAATDIPRRNWLYRPHYIGSYMSLTVAAGGTGKSSLTIVEALSMATGRRLLGVQPKLNLRVWYINLEDPMDELQRRIAAACLHFKIEKEEIDGRLFVNSGRNSPLLIAQEEIRGLKINSPLIEAVTETILLNSIDVVIVDPFVKSHAVSENDNNKIDQVARVWTSIAEETRCAVMLVHHLRKTGGVQGTVDDARGASALLSAARSARVITSMTADQANDVEIPDNERWRYFCSDVGKANLAPRAERANWYKMESVDLQNVRGADWDQGDQVGVATKYELPSFNFSNLSGRDIERVRKVIAEGKWRHNPRSQAEPWAGLAIARVMDFDVTRAPMRKHIVKVLNDLINQGFLKVVERQDRQREKRPYVEVGPNTPDV